ncbi:MAG: hypothetical protein WCL16_07420 [bacterium]
MATEVEALRLLVQIGSQVALEAALGKMLTLAESSPGYGGFLAVFADCRSKEFAALLTNMLGAQKTDRARRRVFAILAAMNGTEVIESLAAQLVNPSDQLHAQDCADMLATARDPGQVAALADLLESGKTPKIQALAACGLASVGNQAACAALVKNGSASDAIAAVCRDALATVGSSYGQEALIKAAVTPAVPSAVRCAAVQALAGQPGQRVEAVLVNLGQATADPALQAVIAQALPSVVTSVPSPESLSMAGVVGMNGEMF